MSRYTVRPGSLGLTLGEGVWIVRSSRSAVPVSTTQRKLVLNATYLGWLYASRRGGAVQRRAKLVGFQSMTFDEHYLACALSSHDWPGLRYDVVHGLCGVAYFIYCGGPFVIQRSVSV